MKKYTQLALIVTCIAAVLALLVCERRYASMKVILEVMDVFETKDSAVKCEKQIKALQQSQLGFLSGVTPSVLPVWTEVLGGAFFAYSAFWDFDDERGQNLTRVIVAFEKQMPLNLKCFVWFDHSHYVEADDLNVVSLDTEGDATSAVLECVVRNVSIKPLGVSLATSRDDARSQVLPLQTTSGNATSNFSACIPPLAAAVTPLTIAEFTIYHRHVGVEDFVFYDRDALPNAKKFMSAIPTLTYSTLALLPWNVPRKFAGVSDAARVADCLLRTKGRSRNVLFLQTHQFVSLYKAKDLSQLSRGVDTLRRNGEGARQLVLFHTHYFCNEFSDDVVASSLDIKFVTQRKVRYHRVSEKHSAYIVCPGFSLEKAIAVRNPNEPVGDNILVPERSAVINSYRECASLFPVRNSREHYVPDMHMTQFRTLLYSSKLYRYFEKQPYASLLL